MQKIRIIGMHHDKSKIVRELHRLGVIDLRRSKLGLEDDKPADILSQVSELVVRYNSAKAILDSYVKKTKTKEKHAKETQPNVTSLLQMAHRFKAVGEIAKLDEKRTDLENEIARLNTEMADASLFIGSGIDFSRLTSESLGFATYVLGLRYYERGKEEIAELSKRCEIIVNMRKTEAALFVAYAKEDAAVLEKIEQIQGLHKIDTADHYLEATPEKAVEKLERLKKKALWEKAEVIAELEKHALEDYNKIETILEMLLIETERASASIGFKRTESTFIIEGWVEKRHFGQISAHLDPLTSGRIEVEEINTDELAPTLVSRPRFLKPFDYLIEFFSLPRSDELDPTWIFILTFPIFYGLMVSDVGYGLASLFFATLLARNTDSEDILHNVAKIWQISSVSVMFFGFLSNQYFGFGLNQYFTGFVGFDWLKNSTTILAVTIIFGIIQVIIGLIFGFFNNSAHGHKKIALSKITSIVVILSGTFAVAGSLFGLISSFATGIATGILIVSLLFTIFLSGREATEIVSMISHPLSYTRMMGFGLASVILALLIDKAFTPSFSGGILGFVFSLIIFILLHFVNMLLGIFEGLVQGVRLNFVEFFSKFYTGGGIKFRPFFYRRHYTKEV